MSKAYSILGGGRHPEYNKINLNPSVYLSLLGYPHHNSRTDSDFEMSERKLRLLCLDGGGVRGLSSLYLLQQLMQAANKDNPPKPCNFFDMIGGTSTGGLSIPAFSG
jgi:hypothetical protein